MVLVGIVALGTSSCQGDPVPTRADYRRRVNAECRDAHAAVALTTPGAVADAERLIAAGRRALVLQRRAAASIAELSRPPSQRRGIARWLNLVRSTLDSAGASLDAQARLDLAAANRANAAGAALGKRADGAARRLGFDDCVTSSPRG